MPCQQEAPVMAIPVPEYARLSILPSLFPRGRFLRVETSVYFWLRQLSPDYVSGKWDFHRLTNAGFFMTPPARTVQYRILSPNGYRGVVSPEAAGVIACLFAYSHLSFLDYYAEFVGEHYHLLREYVCAHQEARHIYAAID